MTWMLILVLAVLSNATRAAEPPELAERAQAMTTAYAKLKFQTGEIDLCQGLVKLKLTEDFRFLDAKDARTVLVDFWGNSPRLEPLGMIVPKAVHLLSTNSWAVVIQYEDGGHVKDADADSIDYNELLKSMRQRVKENNATRKKEGHPALELVGWAAPPHYEKGAHKLHWAKEIKFEGSDGSTVNYDIRVLGRSGVLSMNTVASMDRFEEISRHAQEIVRLAEFTPGNRYSDFNPTSDKVAAYGLAALVAGGIAAKTGLLKGLFLALLAAKKLVIVGAVVLAGLVGKLLSRRQQ